MASKINRQLPSDINAEAAVLSAMMIDNYIVARAVEMFDDENFYRPAHKKIFQAMRELFNNNTEADIITIIDHLKMKGDLEKIGGESFVNELSDVVMSTANFEYHSNIVLQKSLLRQLIDSANKIVENCYNADQPAEDIVDEAEQSIFRIAERPNRRAFQSIASIIPNTIEDIQETAATKKTVHGIPSGFNVLDRKIGGFRPGQLIVLAARPAMGKTSLALNIASNAAVRYDKKIAIFTMEMEGEELLMRMLSSASEVSMDNMLKGYGMNERKLLRISGAAEVLAEKNIYLDDSGMNTILDIRAKSRRLKAELKGLDLIIIDYMQLMSVKRNRENRQQEISEISRSLKILAKEVSVPIIALSQLNRGVESRDDKRPKLSDLRESGAIEQDADVVLFIYRDEVYNEETEVPGIAEIIVGKNRHGAIGKVELKFVGEFTAFRNKDTYE
ncbi:MAG: replicative DNA helicase [Candidatus Cloacimonetes bacterium]|jgi:replicative DNA helicase|nr:replicative DNA helicase [Candidatus Cloacimonadota bacterium]MBT6993411.1 replicative DNA helicase [Candidatus Cloacimonadota bacterium]MBT7470064.1 replicative DNA helicase [Candidatus Cloacimonadota bacterium]